MVAAMAYTSDQGPEPPRWVYCSRGEKPPLATWAEDAPLLEDKSLAAPKSRIRTPLSVSIRLSGLRSRWTSPAWCTFSMAEMAGRKMSLACSQGMGPFSFRRDSSVLPSI